MSKIRAKNTTAELFIRSELHRLGYRYRINYKHATGHPDLYFSKKRIAIFVHGCYWHRHMGCKFAYTPKSNVDFWQKKFADNIERDKVVMNALINDGIRVLVIWECTVKSMMSDSDLKKDCTSRIKAFIDCDSPRVIEL